MRVAPIAFARNAAGNWGDTLSYRDRLCGLRVAAGATNHFGSRARPGEDCDHPHHTPACIVPCPVQVDANGNHLVERAAFEVSPRTEHKVAAIVGGMTGLSVETVASGEHSGGFKITPVQ